MSTLQERPDYWSTYFAVRIACVLHEIKAKPIRQSLRNDLHEYLRTTVPGESTRELLHKELRR